ncbi:hypothetical protein [Mucilaginibacter ginsenosidivorans]|uniref:Uncharacterized protein n=1 Tax=Mucilaginibacter ginsenosidivorans TaxID=398053 RepID=A0A5B8UTR6_9SPHI|nr:hypothetical protein [Mucilaginibacter ginsenosidivorans]QEC62510.1 hypothetical protein FRZ54_07880 [Mucilaginibacter ginsenosidivorans]
MDTTDQPKPNTSDIPKKIFTQLIEELKKSEVPITVIEQLEKTIVTDRNFTEQALRIALSPNAGL